MTLKSKMLLAGIDLSGVEARIELMLAAGTPEFFNTDIGKECVRLAQAHPNDFDIHKYAASIALDKPESSITDFKIDGQQSERQTGKTNMHGFMRGMGAQTMSDSLLKKGYVVTPETCQKRLARLTARLPAIPDGYFVDVRRQAMRFRGLATTWGGIYRCDWQRLDEELYGKMYSYQPVRETVDLINQCGFLPLRREIKTRLLLPSISRERIPRIHVHGHDSLLVSVYPDDVYPLFEFLEHTLGSVERKYYAGSLRVPITFAIGSTWKAETEWKKLPSRTECTEASWACVEKAA